MFSELIVVQPKIDLTGGATIDAQLLGRVEAPPEISKFLVQGLFLQPRYVARISFVIVDRESHCTT